MSEAPKSFGRKEDPEIARIEAALRGLETRLEELNSGMGASDSKSYLNDPMDRTKLEQEIAATKETLARRRGNRMR